MLATIPTTTTVQPDPDRSARSPHHLCHLHRLELGKCHTTAPRHAAGMTSPRELDAAIQSFAVPTGDPHDTCQETSATFTRHCHRHDIEARWLQLAGSPDLDLPPNSPWQGVPLSERHHYLTAIETTDADGAVREWFVCFTYRQFGSSKPMPWVTVNHGWAQSYDVTDSLDLLFPNP